MSLHIHPTTDSRQSTPTETDRPIDGPPTDPSPTGTPPASEPDDSPEADDAPEAEETATDGESRSGIAQCQRQFDVFDTARLRNCVDDENGAMPTPQDP